MNRLFIYSLIIALLTSFGCSETDRKTRSSAVISSPVRITFEGDKSIYRIGESVSATLSIEDSLKGKAVPLIYLNDQLIRKDSVFPIQLNINTDSLRTGSHTIRISISLNGKLIGKTGVFTLLSDVAPKRFTYRIVNTYPHDKEAYTQGLFLHDGILYEGTGQKGLSTLRKVDPQTGRILKKIQLDKSIFGEGIALHNGRLFQLSWTSNVGFIYNIETLEETGRFYFKGEGWGLTSDSKHLIKSDGSQRLTFHNSNDFAELHFIEAFSDQVAVDNLNELEYINDKIYANIWQSEEIAIIDPKTGKVEGMIDLKGILPRNESNARVDVLNGIAYDAEKGHLLITGKYWPTVFEIEVIPAEVP